MNKKEGVWSKRTDGSASREVQKLSFITSFLFYLELFYLLSFLSSLTYSSPPQSTENPSSRSSHSNSNPNTSTAFSAEVLLQILGPFFFFLSV